MIKKVFLFFLLSLVVILLAFWINLKAKNANYEKKYMERILVSDYQGAIAISKEWRKVTHYNNDRAVLALANAYNANFEPQKAVSLVKQYVAYTKEHSTYATKDIAKGYALLAYFECNKGSYSQSNEAYEELRELDPALYVKISTQRYYCRMNELAESPDADPKIRNAFKYEVADYLKKSQNEPDDTPFNKAILAYFVTQDKVLALRFAKAGLEATEKQAERTFSDGTKIPYSVRARMAIFYSVNGDLNSAYTVLGCKGTCRADNLLQQGHDPFYLGYFFLLNNDIKSADVCLRALWDRMLTEEQKQHFFGYTIETRSEESAWMSARKLDWIQKAYSEFKASKKHVDDKNNKEDI